MADRVNGATGAPVRALRLKRGWFAWSNQGPVTVVDPDGDTLRVVQSARRGGKPAVVRFAAVKLDASVSAPDAVPEAIGKAISAALGNLNLKPGPVVMAVPRGLVFLRPLTLPAAGSIEELASMVQFQISKDLPFRLEEAVVDFAVLRFLAPSAPLASESPKTAAQKAEGTDIGQPVRAERSTSREPTQSPDSARRGPESTSSDGAPPMTGNSGVSAQVEVLAAVLKNEIVERYARIAAAAGFKLASLGLRSCANARCVGIRGATGSPQAVALISLRSDEATIEFVADQSVVFSRVASVTRSADSTTAAGDTARATHSRPEEQKAPEVGLPPGNEDGFIQSITTEFVRSLHSYESAAGHAPVEKILITGGTGYEPALVSAWSRRFQPPCELFVPTSAFGVEGADKESGAGALAVLGLAFGAQDLEGLPIDFLNPKRPPVARNWGRIKAVSAAGVLALLLLGVAGLRSHQTNRRLQAKEQVQAQVTQAEKNRPLFRDMRLKAKTARDWMAEKRNWLDHYALLSSLLPSSQDVYLTSLSTGARGVIHLSVQARSGEILAQMDKRLREAGYEVKPLAVTPGTDKFGYPFRSSVELTLSGKTKTDLKTATPLARPADDASLDTPNPKPVSSASQPPPAADNSEAAGRRLRRSQP